LLAAALVFAALAALMLLGMGAFGQSERTFYRRLASFLFGFSASVLSVFGAVFMFDQSERSK
jgi:hypothetical protein